MTLIEAQDERVCAFEKEDHKLTTGLIYRASIRGEQHSFHPLPLSGATSHPLGYDSSPGSYYIQCKVNLEKKGVLTDATCDLCKRSDEDANHIILDCVIARLFWARLGWNTEEIGSVENLWPASPPVGTHPVSFVSFFSSLTVCSAPAVTAGGC